MPMGDQGRRPPAHAGRLRPWERFTIGLVLALMAAGIVAVVVSGGRARSPARAHVPSRNESASVANPASKGGGTAGVSTVPAGPGGSHPGARQDRLLAAALAPVLRHRRGSLAVAIMDSRTGTTAIYNGSQLFQTEGIVSADILAALLLQHQRTGTPLTGQEKEAAAAMIDGRDAGATTMLWDAIGQGYGLSKANRLLHLSATAPGSGTGWGLSSTTVGDQLRLLSDLTSGSSPLSAAARSYELGLMRLVPAARAWGVTAAAAAGTPSAVDNGSAAGRGTAAWVVNSIGVISRAGHPVLIAVLSDGQPTESAGIDEDEAAARAAVSAIIAGNG
jgi:hypothetical protein